MESKRRGEPVVAQHGQRQVTGPKPWQYGWAATGHGGARRATVDQQPVGGAGDPDLAGAAALVDAREVLRCLLPASHPSEYRHC